MARIPGLLLWRVVGSRIEGNDDGPEWGRTC